jgi:hypothetical protein
MMDASGLLRRSSCRAREDYDCYDPRENRDPGSGSIPHALNAIGKSLQESGRYVACGSAVAILSSGPEPGPTVACRRSCRLAAATREPRLLVLDDSDLDVGSDLQPRCCRSRSRARSHGRSGASGASAQRPETHFTRTLRFARQAERRPDPRSPKCSVDARVSQREERARRPSRRLHRDR